MVTRLGVCNGVLLNNTLQDGRQLVLSAKHCFPNSSSEIRFIFNNDWLISKQRIKKVSWETSNYTILAESDDLDFILFEINELIPPYILPYFAGWNASSTLPFNTKGIYTIQDSIMLALDINQPNYVSLGIVQEFGGEPVQNSLLHIASWEKGFTQIGASGSPLFDEQNLLRGTLTAGQSSQEFPFNDYYMRFDFMYDYLTERNRSLIDFLNPNNSDVYSVGGINIPFQKLFNEEVETNQYEPISAQIIEQYFTLDSTLTLHGIFIPIKSIAPDDNLTIKILVSGQEVLVNNRLAIDLYSNTENYISFSTPIKVEDDFRVKLSSEKNITYIASPKKESSIVIDESSFSETSLHLNLLAETFEPVSYQSQTDYQEIRVYPNPILDNLIIEGIENSTEVFFHSITGKRVFPEFTEDYKGANIFNFSTFPKGVYFVTINNLKQKIILK